MKKDIMNCCRICRIVEGTSLNREGQLEVLNRGYRVDLISCECGKFFVKKEGFMGLWSYVKVDKEEYDREVAWYREKKLEENILTNCF